MEVYAHNVTEKQQNNWSYPHSGEHKKINHVRETVLNLTLRNANRAQHLCVHLFANVYRYASYKLILRFIIRKELGLRSKGGSGWGAGVNLI